MRLFTIGFTKKNAEQFFTRLQSAGVKRIVDVRLNNISQLAGFSKRDDLKFFLKGLYGISYIHIQSLAPTQEMLDEYKKQDGGWDVYEEKFISLLAERRIETELLPNLADGDCLLCSEDKPEQCHRRLVVEYLQKNGIKLEVSHL